MLWSVGERLAYLWKHAGEFLLGLGVVLVTSLVVRLVVVPSTATAPVGGAAMISLLGLLAWYLKRAGDKLGIQHSNSVFAFTQDSVAPKAG
jgi:hypothetical protein